VCGGTGFIFERQVGAGGRSEARREAGYPVRNIGTSGEYSTAVRCTWLGVIFLCETYHSAHALC
jgi:hypothetical protein